MLFSCLRVPGPNIQGKYVEYCKNQALTNWTGRCSVPYSEPLLVNSASSTTSNSPTIGEIMKRFQPVADQQNSLFCSPLKAEPPNDSRFHSPWKRSNEPNIFTSTPKKQCFGANYSTVKTNGDGPMRANLESMLSSTNCKMI